MDAKDSCVFRRNWLDAAHTIQDEKLRCYFFEAVMQYALDGMKMDVPPELDLALGIIYSLIDIDRAKYEKKVEKRREAGIKGNQLRWGQKQESQEVAKIANATNATTNIANIADTVTVTDTDTVTDTVRNNDSINPPIAPRGASEAGEGINFEDYYNRVRQIAIPKAIIDIGYENQYAWRIADGAPGYAVDVSHAIAGNQGREQLVRDIYDINLRYQPATPFGAVKLALATARLKTRQQQEAILEEARRSATEPRIYETLLKKAQYIIDGNKVNNLRAFMRARPDP